MDAGQFIVDFATIRAKYFSHVSFCGQHNLEGRAWKETKKKTKT
jgi:hypothetical protein